MNSNHTENIHLTNTNLSGTGPYVLRTLLADLPLSIEEGENEVQISCVEFFGR